MRYLIVLIAVFLALPAQADTRVRTDLPYGSLRQQVLDVYQPDSCRMQGSCPVVIWVHGGGWRNGNKGQRSTPDMLKMWAASGIVMVSIDYRLTPDVMHPEHIRDVASAIAWTFKHIGQYGGDRNRISLLGHSAGAHLVALAGTSPVYLAAHDLRPSDLKFVFPIDTASFDLATNPTPMVQKMIREAFGTDPAVLREASPIWNIRPGTAYPAFIIAATKARPDAVETSNQLARKLRGVGASAQVLVMDYGTRMQLRAHADIARDLANPDSPMTRTLMAAVLGR